MWQLKDLTPQGILMVMRLSFMLRYQSQDDRSHFQNGGVKTFKNLLLHISNEKTGKMVRINIFWTLEINQRLRILRGIYSLKNGWISVNREVYGILTCAILISLSPVPWWPWKLTPCNHVAMKTSSLEVIRGGKVGLELLNGLVPKELSLFNPSGSSL